MRILFIFLLTSGTIIGQLPIAVIDIEAGVSTAVSSPMFEDDFGPVSGDESMTLVFSYWDDYYYEEVSDTVDLAYSVENDTLSINATMDLCEKRYSLISVQKPAHRHCK
tara:strand:+ start:98 stop:424 length:327 start_codon:yes stop_codon:yes gene_type:complete